MKQYELQDIAHQILISIQPGDQLPIPCISEESILALTAPTNLEELLEVAHSEKGASDEKIHQDIIYIEACLRNPLGLNSVTSTHEILTKLCEWTAKAILPDHRFAENLPSSQDFEIEAPLPQATKWQCRAIAGLRLLLQVSRISSAAFSRTSLDLIVCLASYTNKNDPWTSPEASELTRELLELDHDGQEHLSPAMVEAILQTHVRPLFEQSRSAAITKQGRKAMAEAHEPIFSGEQESVTKPWKHGCRYIVTVFQWTLGQSDTLNAGTYLPLIIPPLLAILDDASFELKVTGCQMLTGLLSHMEPSLLQRTGLGEVFEDSLLPLLSHLPPLVTEEESLRVLGIAYSTISVLTQARYPTPDYATARIKLQHQIMRIGILRGFAYAGENAMISTLLLTQISHLVDSMGLASIKHLKNLIPLLIGILTDPFATAYLPHFIEAERALISVMINSWPRVEFYCGEIFKGLACGWLALQSEERESTDLMTGRTLLQDGVDLLIACLEDPSHADEIRTAFLGNTKLAGLLRKASPLGEDL